MDAQEFETPLVGMSMLPPKAQAINGEIACFDVVIATGDCNYPYLVGEVNAVNKLGTEDHTSGSLTDDVFVDFDSEIYSAQRIREIEEYFSEHNGKQMRYEEFDLSNVRISPDKLICIPAPSADAISQVTDSYMSARAYCDEILTKIAKTSRVINGEVEVGNWIIVKPGIDYGCLVGQVTDIDKLGSPNHGTDNKTDDIHVNLIAADYGEHRLKEIAEQIGKLYGVPKHVDELPLDDVIMAPDMLLSLCGTDLDGHDEIFASYNDAYEFGNELVNCYFDSLENELLDRVEQNFTDYNKSLLSFGKQEIIDMAGRIEIMDDAYTFMTTDHDFTDDELYYYLKFQNPLEVVADEWAVRRSDLEDMCYAMDSALEHRDEHLARYALVGAVPEVPAAVEPASANTTPPKKQSIKEQILEGQRKLAERDAKGVANTKNTRKEMEH